MLVVRSVISRPCRGAPFSSILVEYGIIIFFATGETIFCRRIEKGYNAQHKENGNESCTQTGRCVLKRGQTRWGLKRKVSTDKRGMLDIDARADNAGLQLGDLHRSKGREHRRADR